MADLEIGAPCIVCRKQLGNLMAPEGNQPNDGVAFTSPGHYGSAAFDPMDMTFLEINVCDDCLVAAAKDGAVLVAEKSIPKPPAYEKWTGPRKWVTVETESVGTDQ